jgi:hypothetical protein
VTQRLIFARVGLKPFDIGIDRALKALRLHVRIAAVFGAKLRPLPGNRRNIWGGSKHLFYKRSAPQIDQCHPIIFTFPFIAFGIRIGVGNVVLLRKPERGMPIQAGAPIFRQAPCGPPCIAPAKSQALVSAAVG